MAASLTGDSQIQNAASAAFPQSVVYITALLKFSECFPGRCCIAIDLPWTYQLTVLAFVLYEPFHVIEGISKEYAYLVREGRASVRIIAGDPCLKMSETVVQTAALGIASFTAVARVIAISMKE